MTMIPKLLAGLVLAGMSLPTLAQHDHDEHHEASLGAVAIVHPWARAAAAGSDTMVFFDVENTGAAMPLSGAHSDVAASVEIVGASLNAEGQRIWQPIGEFQIPAGDFAFDPDGLGLRLSGLVQALEPGQEFELELILGGQDLHLHVAVEAADANQHGHAGHSH